MVQPAPSAAAIMQAGGEMPLPPYLKRPEESSDKSRYQTIFASESGAIAAPTAGLHISESIVADLTGRGVDIAAITLHVGPGTFRNLRTEDLDTGTLHAEVYSISNGTVEKINRTRSCGGRIVAVGTTSTRCLESASNDNGEVKAGVGTTDLFIQSGFTFRVVDRLFTNFHLPRSSLLMLACAFGGRERVLSAYRAAISEGYRFYSYGDAMLLDPKQCLPSL